MSRTLRNLILAVGLVAVVIVVGVYRHRHLTTPTTTTTSTSTTTTSLTPTTSTSTSTTTSTVASLTTCRAAGFTGTNLGSEGAAGTGYDTMTLTKVSAGSCVVDGYPILTFDGANGAPVTGLSVSHSTAFASAPANVGAVAYTVNDGGRIDVQFRYSDVPSGAQTCASVTQVDVQFVAGDASVPVSFPYPISPCPSTGVGVSAFYPD